MAKSQIEASAPRKPLSTLNGLRAVVFGSSLLGFLVLTFGGGLIGNAVAFSIPYMLAAMALSNYLVRDLFGIGAGDALFASDDQIRDKRPALSKLK